MNSAAARACRTKASAALLHLLLDLSGPHPQPCKRRHPRAGNFRATCGDAMPQLVRGRRSLVGTPKCCDTRTHAAHARAYAHAQLVKRLVRLSRCVRRRLTLEQPAPELLDWRHGDCALEGALLALGGAHRRVPSDPDLEELSSAHRAQKWLRGQWRVTDEGRLVEVGMSPSIPAASRP